MPATEQTWRNQRRLHLIFGVSALLMLGATLWMFAADHQREWKTFQRKTREIEVTFLDWRQAHEQLETNTRTHREAVDEYEAARAAAPPKALIDSFLQTFLAHNANIGQQEQAKAKNPQDPSVVVIGKKFEIDVTGIESAYQALLEPATTAAANHAEAVRVQTAAYETEAKLAQAEIALLDSQALIETASDRKKAEADHAAAEKNRDKLLQELKDLKTKVESTASAAGSSEKTAQSSRQKLLDQLTAAISKVRFTEDNALQTQKDKAAMFDKAKADHGLGIRDHVSQEKIDSLLQKVEVAEKNSEVARLDYQSASDLRRKLDGIVAQIQAPVEDAKKKMDAVKAELKRIDTAMKDRRATWFTGGFPFLGKKFLELPILDAFNSPLKIQQDWLPKLTLNNNFRDVARFDRCSTCHMSVEKSAPGRADVAAYVSEREVTLALTTPKNEELNKLKVDENGQIAPLTLLKVYGIELASRGLVRDSDVAIQRVTPGKRASQASVMLGEDATKPENGGEIRRDLIHKVTPTPAEPHGFQVGDVIVKIGTDTIESAGEAEQLLLEAVTWGQPVKVVVRRGLPHPFVSHPRLDLFVGSLSPHKKQEMGCTICHEGQGSATAFKWSSHTPADLKTAHRWQQELGWFDNHHWIFPMNSKQFVESSCLKCHHTVDELRPSVKFPDAPAPKVVHGFDLIARNGCFGCHEINGTGVGNKTIGPDLRLEPNYSPIGLSLMASANTALQKLKDKPAAEQQELAAKLAQIAGLGQRVGLHPEDTSARMKLLEIMQADSAAAKLAAETAKSAPVKSVTEKPAAEAPATPAGSVAAGEQKSAAPVALFSEEDHKLATQLKDVESPGNLRKVGPSLRYAKSKLDPRFVYDWLADPRNFRYNTRMPQFFGNWDHLKDDPESLAKAKSLESIEIQGIVAYLNDRSQSFTPVADPKDIPASPKPEQVTRGKLLFETRGCLACHSHDAFTKTLPNAKADHGPDLSGMGDKLLGPDGTPYSAVDGRAWLKSWLRAPSHYSARTLMPELMLTPTKELPGRVTEAATPVYDPAADIAEFLLTSRNGYKPVAMPEKPDPKSLDELTLENLSKAFFEVDAARYLKEGIPETLRSELKGAEAELVGTKLPLEELNRKKLLYVGRKAIGKYGCYACHDVPGFEDGKPIGTALTDWGRKDPSKLAFEQILPYLTGGHGHGGGHGKGSHGADGHDEPGNVYVDLGKSAKAHSDDGKEKSTRDHGPLDPFFLSNIQHHNRIGFLYQKIREPRSYDYEMAMKKPFNDWLRMPQFRFSAEEREAIMTFVLGLVAEPPVEQYIYKPQGRAQAIVAGERVLQKYSCASCHMLEAEKWQLSWRGSGDPTKPVFPEPSPPDTFPFTIPYTDPAKQAETKKADPRGFFHGTITGVPNLEDDGLPSILAPNPEGGDPDPLDPDSNYDPASLLYGFQLWQPAVIQGNVYPVGAMRKQIPYDMVKKRYEARGGDLAKMLMTRVLEIEKEANSNAKGSQVWGWLPPPLMGEGVKVQTPWLHDFLLDPYPIRPATVLRMPKFNMSSREASILANYFAAKDDAEYPYSANERTNAQHLASAEAAYEKHLKALGDSKPQTTGARFDDAMKIVTDKAGCVQCHQVADFVPQSSVRAQGPDLSRVSLRLRPDYTRRWIANPAYILPYTGMPAVIKYSPGNPTEDGYFITKDGKKTALYHGSSTEQVDALVDLLMNFDKFTKQKTKVKDLIPKDAPATPAPATPAPATPASGTPAAPATPGTPAPGTTPAPATPAVPGTTPPATTPPAATTPATPATPNPEPAKP